jgi:hypothetical protein
MLSLKFHLLPRSSVRSSGTSVRTCTDGRYCYNNFYLVLFVLCIKKRRLFLCRFLVRPGGTVQTRPDQILGRFEPSLYSRNFGKASGTGGWYGLGPYRCSSCYPEIPFQVFILLYHWDSFLCNHKLQTYNISFCFTPNKVCQSFSFFNLSELHS